MLQGTPNLCELYISIYLVVHPLEGVLTKDDFIVPLQDQGQEEDDAYSQNVDSTSPQDLNHSIDLHSQPFHIFSRFYSYLTSVSEEKKTEPRSTAIQPGDIIAPPQLSDQRPRSIAKT